MIWNDEFNGPNLNTTKWQREVNCGGGGNNEQQCYVPDAANSYIENGTLVLKAIQGWRTGSQDGCTDWNGCTNTLPYTSARVRTMMDPQGSWAGGRFEISARLPDGAYLWPAIWMLPQTSAYGGWAASGEIDIMEFRGQNLYSYSSTLHYGGSWPNNRYWGQDHSTPDLSQGYHQWALEWTVGDKMDFYFDGQWVQNYPLNRWWWDASYGNANPYSAPGQPWDKPFYMIMNLAVGGNFFGGGTPAWNQGSLWRQPTLSVDYVRVYKWDTSVPTTQGVSTRAVSTAAVTTSPVTTSPVTTSPVTTSPVTTSPVSTQAVTTSPVTTQAVSTSPVTTSPVSTSPVTTSPVTTTPVTTSPVSTEAVSTQAVSTEAVTTESVTTMQATTEAVTTEAATTQIAVPPPGTTAGPVQVGTTGQAAETTTGQSQPIQTDTDTTTTGAGSTESVSTTGTVTLDNSTDSQTNDTSPEGLPIESEGSQNKASVKDKNSKQLSQGGEIGVIVAACICGAILIAAAGYVVWKKRVQKSEAATVAVDDLVI